MYHRFTGTLCMDLDLPDEEQRVVTVEACIANREHISLCHYASIRVEFGTPVTHDYRWGDIPYYAFNMLRQGRQNVWRMGNKEHMAV